MDWFVYGFSGLSIACAFMVVTRRNPIVSALYLCLALFSLAALFILLEAYFIAAVQVLIYAGAVMVLFVFVIMLLNLDPEKMNIKSFNSPKFLAIASSVVLFCFFAYMYWTNPVTGEMGYESPAQIANSGGHLEVISAKLFSSFILAFEVTSLMLLVAMVGAVVLAKRKV